MARTRTITWGAEANTMDAISGILIAEARQEVSAAGCPDSELAVCAALILFGAAINAAAADPDGRAAIMQAMVTAGLAVPVPVHHAPGRA